MCRQVRRLCDIIGCDIQPVQNLKVLNMAVAKEESKEAKDAGKAAWAKHYITEGFVALEQALVCTSVCGCLPCATRDLVDVSFLTFFASMFVAISIALCEMASARVFLAICDR